MDRRKALQKVGLLAGAAVTLPSAISLLQSCKDTPRLTWKPEFFDEIDAKTISSIIDMILPRTDTPGALDVKVDIFIDRIVAQTYNNEGKQKMKADIVTFNENCKTDFGAFFIDLNNEKRIEVLQQAEKTSGKINPGVWGKTVGKQEPIGFYRALKSMAIWAYTTSEEIGENVLSYDPVPGNYEPCKPVSEVGKKWSLG